MIDAVAALADGGALLGGGTVVVPGIAGGGPPGTLIDLAGIEGLRGLEAGGRAVRIGAMVTLARLAWAPELAGADGALAAAAGAIGNPNVRRVATIGGNVAQNLRMCDLHPPLLVLEAALEVRDALGARELPGAVLAGDGIPTGTLVEAVRVPLEAGRRSSFVKLAWRKSSGITVCGVAASLRLEGGMVQAPRLAAAGLQPRASRLARAEAALAGRPLHEAIEDAARAGAAELPFAIDGAEVPGEAYRRRLVAEGIRRALGEVGRA